jgi:hypothetical protein
MENLWATYGRGMGKRWRTPCGGGISSEEFGIGRLGSCTPSVVVIPTEGRDLWVAEKESIGDEQRRAPFHPQVDSTTHRSLQEDKAIGITDQGSLTAVAIRSLPAVGRTRL